MRRMLVIVLKWMVEVEKCHGSFMCNALKVGSSIQSTVSVTIVGPDNQDVQNRI